MEPPLGTNGSKSTFSDAYMCPIQENCSILVKSMKFGTSVGFAILSICGYRAKSISSQNSRWPPKIQNGRHR